MNSLVSAKSALPIEYYSLPFCRPAKIVSSAENLGEVLRGDRIYNSLYQVRLTRLRPGSTRRTERPCTAAGSCATGAVLLFHSGHA